MDKPNKDPETESLPVGVYELPGEPAIVINGVPTISPNAKTLQPDPPGNTKNLGEEFLGGVSGFGEWMEGREVKKLFGDRYYTGSVAHFDKEFGWYRVVYEDGDFEDLDWNELQELILPLDVGVPLKSLALRVVKKGESRGNQKVGKRITRAQGKRGGRRSAS